MRDFTSEEKAEVQQEHFGRTTGKDYRGKAIKQYFSIAKERCLFNDESLQNAFYEGFLDCAEFLLPLIEKMKCYYPVDERDSNHKWFAYKNLFDTEWKIDYSVQGELPKCNTIKWFENKEAVMFYLVSNGMKYYEEPRR